MFTVDARELATAVAFLSRAVPPTGKRSPELGGVCLVTTEDELIMTVTDLDTTAVAHLEAHTNGDDAVVVSARLWAALVATLPKVAELTLALPAMPGVGGNRAAVSCGSAAWLLPTMSPDLYPALPAPLPYLATVDGAELSAALAQVVPAAGSDPILPKFYGVQVEIEGDLLHLVASDRYRLAVAELEVIPQGPNLDHRALVPLGIAEALTLAVEGPVRVCADSSALALETAHYGVHGRVSGERFPEWRGFAGLPGPGWAAADRREVERAIRQVSVTGALMVDLGAREGHLALVSPEDDTTAGVDAVLVGETFDRRVRINYLREALAAVGTDWISIEPGPKRVILAPADKAGDRLPGYRHTVMTLTGVPR